MSEIIGVHPNNPREIGKRYFANFDRPQHDGTIRTHYNVPYMVLRQVTGDVYREHHPDFKGTFHPGELFYEVSID